MARALLAASLAWPLILGSAVLARQHGRVPVWTTAIYAAASRICHQRPERSFFTNGVQWPVCGRCSGLYLAAPLGAAVALRSARRRRRFADARVLVAAAAVPTLLTIALEWMHVAAISTVDRAIAAVPLGLAIAYALVGVTAKPDETDRVH